MVKYALEKVGRIAVVFLSNTYNRSLIMRRASDHSYENVISDPCTVKMMQNKESQKLQLRGLY